MIPRLVAIFLLVAGLLALAGPASADDITYVWVGDNGFTGSFTIPSSAFAAGPPEDGFQVPDSAITAFTFSGDGVTFGLADIGRSFSAGASIAFNSLVSPPVYEDGAGGSLAVDVAGDSITLFPPPEAVEIELADGSFQSSTGEWVPSTALPEPGTLILLAGGLFGLSVSQRKRAA